MKKILILMLAVSFVLALGLALSPRSVRAEAYIDFSLENSPVNASILYAGGATPLVGALIGVDKVTGVNTPNNAGPLNALTITSGTLDFTTGNFSSAGADDWEFSGGGSITLKGAIAALGIPAGTTLLSGSFTSAEVDRIGTGDFKIAGTAFADTKNQDLAHYFGWGIVDGVPNVWQGNFNLGFFATGSPPGGFETDDGFDITSGDLTNSPIPEPATMFLLGSGLIGLAGFARRRFKK